MTNHGGRSVASVPLSSLEWYLKLRDAAESPDAVHVDATLVTLPTPPIDASTARTTILLRMSARNASYHELCVTSSRSASAAPAESGRNLEFPLTHRAGG